MLTADSTSASVEALTPSSQSDDNSSELQRTSLPSLATTSILRSHAEPIVLHSRQAEGEDVSHKSRHKPALILPGVCAGGGGGGH